MNRKEIISVLQLQHEAIDMLLAQRAHTDPTFLPSKSGKPWEAIEAGYFLIKQLEALG